jgi:hypothetical protein
VRGSYIPFAGDFDGQFGADIFFYGPATGPDLIWRAA